MRPYKKSDHDYVVNALLSEELTLEDMTFKTDYTFIADIGFFSYRTEGKYPRLIHFYVNPNSRSLKNGHRLMRIFKRILIEQRYLFFIAYASRNKKYLNTFFRYLKGKIYKENNGDTYYYVPTFGRFI